MMIYKLLDHIKLKEEEQTLFWQARELSRGKEEEIAYGYMRKNVSYQESMDALNAMVQEKLPIETLYFLFFSACAKYLLEDYQNKGVSEEIFWDSMKDFRYKITECQSAKDLFGIFVPGWYDKFFKMNRFALGRLQYDISAYDNDSIVIENHPIHEGDFILYCHIPAAGPLTPESVLDSLKRAYHFFKDRLKDGVLVVKCCSWILYPGYQPLFKEGGNLDKFSKNFFLVSHRDLDNFSAAYLIFGKDYRGNVEELPQDTSLRKKFVQYIKENGTFGDGSGIILFDGETIMTYHT